MRSLRDVRGRTGREPLTSSMEGLAHARPNNIIYRKISPVAQLGGLAPARPIIMLE